MRKSKEKFPFDVLILTQTPVESEQDILLDHDGEPAAKYKGDARIYRLKDNRFAMLALNPSVLLAPPNHIEFWNWWGKTPTPSFSDLTTAKEIDHKIRQINLLRKESPCSLPS